MAAVRRRGGGDTASDATTAVFHHTSSSAGVGGAAMEPDVRDRTSEFRAACQTYKQRQTAPAPPTPTRTRTEFMKDAGAIGKEIKATTDKLERLAKLAQRRSLFDDPAEEINEMTAIIKQSITHLNTEVKDLKQRAAGEADAGSRQSQQHSKGVISSLQSTLKKTTADFMTVVKQRRQNVADQEERKSQFGASSVPLRSNIFAPAAAEGGGEREGGPYSSGGLGDTFESQNQLVSMQPQDYLQQRADDVEQVESTIRELGGIFGQLANIVAEQDEMVHRIDSNVDEMDTNVQGAQAELFKYLNSISSNRALIAKVFAVMMFFAAIWVVFFV